MLAVVLLGCSASPPPADPPPPQQQEPEPPGAAGNPTCAADADCVPSPYRDPAQSGGCCPAIAGPTCVAEVVTVTEAERRRAAWEAQCSAVRCAPSASCATGIWTPVPACRDGVCVDTARPDHSATP